VARAQQSGMPVIRYLSEESAADDSKIVTIAFLQSLKETGYVEGPDEQGSSRCRWQPDRRYPRRR
jgi:hypothetical protein